MILLAILGHWKGGLLRRRTVAGSANPAEAQAARVGMETRLGLLVQRMVRALGLPGQQLVLGQDHVLGVLDVRNAATAGQLAGGLPIPVGGLALGAVHVVKEVLAQLRLRVGELAQLGSRGCLAEVQVQLQIAGLAEGGGLLLVVLLRLVDLVDQVVGVGQVGRQVLLHGIQVARADGSLQDLAPVLLGEALNVRPRGGEGFRGLVIVDSSAHCPSDVLGGAAAEAVCARAAADSKDGAANGTGHSAARAGTSTGWTSTSSSCSARWTG